MNIKAKKYAIKRLTIFLTHRRSSAFLKNKRALSPVISNLILIAAVITVGMVALSYAIFNSNNYQTKYQEDIQQDITQYHQSVNESISKMRETLCFEYVFYDGTSHNLYVYVLNSGKITVTITSASVDNSVISFAFYAMNGEVSNGTLGVGEEKYAVYTASPSLSSGAHTVKLSTIRGSIFEYSFLS